MESEIHLVKSNVATESKIKSYCSLHGVRLTHYDTLSHLCNILKTFSKTSVVCFELANTHASSIKQVKALANSFQLVVVASNSMDINRQMLESGCRGIINIEDSPARVFNALDAILNCELWFPRSILSSAYSELLEQHSITQPIGDRFSELTTKENEIATYLIKGYQNKEIAKSLYISVNTVKTHVQSILRKTGLSNRAQLSQQLSQ